MEQPVSTFTTDAQHFLLDGQPFRILSGAMHYFRIHPDCWRDRLLKLKAMGLNTLETYMPWNLHEPRPGQFDFSGWLDLERYIGLAGELDLKVIVRPGPYICSEWEFGGLPAWLLKDAGMRVRCAYPPYLAAADRYLDEVAKRLAPLQITRGGPLVAVQVENEYGSFGNDSAYLQHLHDGLRKRGFDLLLFTSDGPSDEMLQYGTLPRVLKTVNFGSRAKEGFEKLRAYQPEGPLMCAEFWNGWFDHWGEKHHTRPVESAAQALDEILSCGASVSLYMFHGGTNFGLMNGANAAPGPRYQATVTSYDYDSPLDEAGNPTAKYAAFRDVIARHTGQAPAPIPAATPAAAFGKVRLHESAGLLEQLDALSSPVESAFPLSMEELDQNYGLIYYRTLVSGPRDETRLRAPQVHDRAQVWGNGKRLGTLEREKPGGALPVQPPQGGLRLELLVENMGRVNYGPELNDRKGLPGGVLLGQQYLMGWTNYALPLDNLTGLRFAAGLPEHFPAFLRGGFQVGSPADTYLALPGWTKGIAWVNGFNLGRYWKRGPQKTLYIPGQLLRAGANELVILELEGLRKAQVELRDTPDLG